MTDAFSKASHGSPLGGLKAQPASAIPTTTSCVGGPTTFEQLKPLFRQMSPYQLQLTANHLIPHATDLEALTCRKFDLVNQTERHFGENND